jgi:hypothetical protein
MFECCCIFKASCSASAQGTSGTLQAGSADVRHCSADAACVKRQQPCCPAQNAAALAKDNNANNLTMALFKAVLTHMHHH